MGIHYRRWRSLVMAGVAVAVTACSDPSAPVTPGLSPHAPAVVAHAVTGMMVCEVTVESGFAPAIGAEAATMPTIECSPSADRSSAGEGAGGVFASDTILQRFADIGFTYQTPAWSVVAGVGGMTVNISVINHIAKPLGTSNGVHPAPSGTRVVKILRNGSPSVGVFWLIECASQEPSLNAICAR